MWKWLKASVDYDRLKEENDRLRGEIKELRAELLEEIDSNREREDALVRNLCQGQDLGRRRHLLTPPLPEDDEPDPDDQPVPQLIFGEFTTDMVKLRARDYMAEAAKNGMYYDFDELCKAIAANPTEYLSN